ncbi:hypothetical protein [Thermoanaerobacterium thermosaccharolyticum]|uniref:hypothetical protein n=1 Tax=Thermoanaerobacterium thermosaccharolyticum TaxID=1517 RepID=UPI00177AB22C|nr:hypothetical protein [Thermoanaerobacterium thermosaccharolyticum]MBE0069829.1 hypothetical protein [Thermoanaerobacterium thermosaccharolyticum]MBE0227507.1 hypothetical protein [Thermoanaerobacterium thermosaccharolyticum]
MLSQKCEGCFKAEKGQCTVFVSPIFQWRDGRKCFGYVDDPAVMLKMYEDMYKYNLDRGNDVSLIKRNIERYQKLVEQA